jgi:homoserine dehydrogenase
VGQVVMRGAGAGMGPTASAVMGDVMDIARGLRLPIFGVPAAGLVVPVAAAVSSASAWYLRMTLVDKPGALAKVATALGDAGISIDRMRQYDHEDAQAPVLIVTHKATRDDVNDALSRFAGTGVVLGEPVALRIEDV